MIDLSADDNRLKYTTIYNIDRQINDIRDKKSIVLQNNKDTDFILDDFYGKIFQKSVYKFNHAIYGNSILMDYFEDFSDHYEIVDFLRVPYRKIPVFQVSSNDDAKNLITKIKDKYDSKQILLRGQVNKYSLQRSKEDLLKFYGDENAFEPSFLSSFCRGKFDEKFIRSLWNCQGRILLNDIYVDLREELSKNELEEFNTSRAGIEGTMWMSNFSLGMAQHYGLPSIGLDLTDNYETALCFASNTLEKCKPGIYKVSTTKDFTESMLYVFVCPYNVVFSYKITKPVHFPDSRPDCQDAWFGYVGWGDAKNQMAMYLDCCIKVTPELYNEIDPNHVKSLFPSAENDKVLKKFMNLKNNSSYTDEVKEIFNNVYDVEY